MSVKILFRSKNRQLSKKAVEVLEAERPMTLRQLFYRLISKGCLANKQSEYQRLGNLMTRLREAGEVPRNWIVDHVRATLKPSSWSGLADFADTVRDAYRKDFWASLDRYVAVFVEKDAIAGTIQPVTSKYDVPLHVCRGYASVSFAGEIAEEWAEIEKPIFASYLGDFDPSGFDIERDLREKLARYSGRTVMDQIEVQQAEHEHEDRAELFPWSQVVVWTRLAIQPEDFVEHDLIALPVKHADKRASGFVQEHGDQCAEVDALQPTELRRRVEEAIFSHIDSKRWAKLQEVEALEQQSLETVLDAWQRETQSSSTFHVRSPAGGAG